MDSVYVRNLIMTVIKHSESEYWEDACTIVKRVEVCDKISVMECVARFIAQS